MINSLKNSTLYTKSDIIQRLELYSSSGVTAGSSSNRRIIDQNSKFELCEHVENINGAA